jgi:amino acid/amide ABC transporter substrate-binding protein, HAAT family (TC 3.A.1.4.-)
MKKLIALVLAVMMLVPAFAMADNVIKIGVFEPSTGDNGAGGKQEILGIEYANSLAPTVTIGGEEYTVELVIEDNQSLTDKAISAAQSLVSKDVAVVLGSYGSGVSMAGGDVFAEAGVPAIGISCTNPNVTLLCDYYWRICFLDPFQGTVMANFAKELGASKAYVLTMLGEDYGVGLGKYLWKRSRAWAAKSWKRTSPKAPAISRPISTTRSRTAATWYSRRAPRPTRP